MTESAVSTSTRDRIIPSAGRCWEQIGAAGGIAYVVLQLFSQSLIQVGGAEPAFDAPAEEIVTFFLNRNTYLAGVGSFLSVLSLIALSWFLGALWAALRRREGDPGWLSLVAFACGISGIATILIGGAGWELALMRIDELPAEVIQLLFDLGNYSFAAFWVALAGMLLATGILTVRDGALPGWLGWFALILVVGLLGARAVWATTSGIKFIPYALFWVWLIATSIVLIRRARRAHS